MSDEQQSTPTVDRIEQAARFRALHEGPEPLLLPNAWDGGSAKILAALGFKAIATTSGGFAASIGTQRLACGAPSWCQAPRASTCASGVTCSTCPPSAA